MLPFPPRVFAKEYLALNPLGTIPLHDRWRNQNDGVLRHLSLSRHPLWADAAVGRCRRAGLGAFLNWMYFSDATLTFPQTLVLRYSQLEPEERRNPQVAGDYAKWFLGRLRAVEAATGQRRDAVRRPVHRGRYRDRLCAAAGREYRACQGFRAQRRGLLAAPAGSATASSGRSRPKMLAGDQQKVARRSVNGRALPQNRLRFVEHSPRCLRR